MLSSTLRRRNTDASLCEVSHTHLRASVYGLVGELDDALVVLLEEYLTLVGGDQTHNHIKGSGLSGTVGTKQSHDLALVDVNGDVIHHRA